MPGVHDAADEVRDLQQLLFSARIPPPYVLVGHSYGGLLTRLYAHDHPRDVAGMVLVDAIGRNMTERQLAIWPRSVEPGRRARRRPQPVTNGVDLRSSEQLDARVRTLGDLPLVVIAAGRHRAALRRRCRAAAAARGGAAVGAHAGGARRALERPRARRSRGAATTSSSGSTGSRRSCVGAVRAVVRAARDEEAPRRARACSASPASAARAEPLPASGG